MSGERREQLLRELVSFIQRRHLIAPARIVLDIVAPLGMLASQAALFVQPFTPRGRWHDYVDALGDEASWRRLHDLVQNDDRAG